MCNSHNLFPLFIGFEGHSSPIPSDLRGCCCGRGGAFIIISPVRRQRRGHAFQRGPPLPQPWRTEQSTCWSQAAEIREYLYLSLLFYYLSSLPPFFVFTHWGSVENVYIFNSTHNSFRYHWIYFILPSLLILSHSLNMTRLKGTLTVKVFHRFHW